MPPSKGISRKLSVHDAHQEKSGGGNGEITPYELDTFLPLRTLQPLSRAGENGRSTQKVVQAVDGGTPDGPSSRPLLSADGMIPHLPTSLI